MPWKAEKRSELGAWEQENGEQYISQAQWKDEPRGTSARARENEPERRMKAGRGHTARGRDKDPVIRKLVMEICFDTCRRPAEAGTAGCN